MPTGWAPRKIVSICWNPGVVNYTGLVISKHLALREAISTTQTTEVILSPKTDVSTRWAHNIAVFTICKSRIDGPAVWSHRVGISTSWTAENSGFTSWSPQRQISATRTHKTSVDEIWTADISTVTHGTFWVHVNTHDPTGWDPGIKTPACWDLGTKISITAANWTV